MLRWQYGSQLQEEIEACRELPEHIKTAMKYGSDGMKIGDSVGPEYV